MSSEKRQVGQWENVDGIPTSVEIELKGTIVQGDRVHSTGAAVC